MSASIPVYPRKSILGTRRVHGGCYILNPTPQTKLIIGFLAVHYALKYNLRLVAFNILGNHVHWVIDDVDGNYPKFTCAFYSAVQKVLYNVHGRVGILWEPRKPSCVRLEGDTTIMNALLYVATNSVKHRIAPDSRAWDGLLFSPEQAGETLLFVCPPEVKKVFPSFPDHYDYEVPIPWVYGKMSASKVRTDFRRRRLNRERHLAAKHTEAWIGLDTAMSLGPDDYADPPEPRPNLTLAADDDLLEDALADLSHWRRAYHEARKLYLRGKRPTWPAGTFAMHAWHNCPRHGP